MNRNLTACVILAAISGCSAPPAAAREVRVAAAASLKFALDDVTAAFHRQHPDITVRATTGASGSLAAQIALAAPFDLFLAADFESPQGLVDRKLAEPVDLFRYASGRLVVWVPAGSRLDLADKGLAALADPAVRRVALANPRHAPYGRAAEAALTKFGLMDALRERLVYGENAEQAAQFAHSGAADAGLLPRSLTFSQSIAGGRIWLVPADAHPPIEQAGVILSTARDRAAAEALRDFLLRADGQAILGRHGFDPPGG